MAIIVCSVLFRAPSLANAAATNSDAAVPGLQAMHALRGEVSPFLWGSGYQTSVDSLVAAIWFVVTGPTPLALMLSTLASHVALTLLAWSTLRRHLELAASVLLVAPLVFTGGPIHTYVLYPPRQASLTLVFLAVWLLDRADVGEPGDARAERRATIALVAGAFAAGLAVFADPYALLFAPVLVLFGLDVARVVRGPRRVALAAASFAFASLPYLALRALPNASAGQTSLTTHVVGHNLELLTSSCWPWAMGTTPYVALHMSDYEPWRAGWPFRVIQLAGAALFLAAILAAGAMALRRDVPRALRRLGLFGAAMLPITLVGFLLSPMVMDHFSSRYLVAFILASPFTLAPLAHRYGPRVLAIAVVPFALSAAVSGWVSYAPFVRGPWIDASWGRQIEETKLRDALRAREVRFAEADYWASYRLTFLFREDPIVVPTNPAEDRYPPYRQAFAKASRVAYVYDALRSREAAGDFAAKVARGETEFSSAAERLELGEFTVLILTRAP